MNILTKTALCTMAAGAVIFAAGFAVSGFDIKKLSDVEYDYTEESFTFDGSLDLDFSSLYDDVRIERSPDGNIHIDCRSGGNIRYNAAEKNGTVVLECENEPSKIRLTFINIDFSSEKKPPLTIKLPENYSGIITADINDGKLDISDISAEKLAIKLKYGDVKIKNSGFSVVSAELASGDLSAEKTAVSESLDLDLKYGEFSAEECRFEGTQSVALTDGDAEISDSSITGSFELSSSYGDIELSASEFQNSLSVVSSDGSIKIKDCAFAEGGSFETLYGDIKGTVTGSDSDYSIVSEVRYGKSSLRTELRDGKPAFYFKSDSGDIDIKFSSQH